MTVRLATSPKDVLQGSEPALMELLRGVHLDVKTHLWKGLSDVLLKLLDMGGLPEKILPILGGASPLLLLKMNGSLELEIDDEMKEKLAANPLLEIALMDAATLVNSMAGCPLDDDEEFETFLTERVVMAPLIDAAKLLSSNLGDEININIFSPMMSVTMRIQGEGLRSLAKAGVLMHFKE